jgi:hypothetical protein
MAKQPGPVGTGASKDNPKEEMEVKGDEGGVVAVSRFKTTVRAEYETKSGQRVF